MNNRRLQQQADAAALKAEVDGQIQETNSDLFNADGTLKGKTQRTTEKEEISGWHDARRAAKNRLRKVVRSLHHLTSE